jgi:hypothetical protein
VAVVIAGGRRGSGLVAVVIVDGRRGSGPVAVVIVDGGRGSGVTGRRDLGSFDTLWRA